MMLMIPLLILLGMIQGFIEGAIINKRTRLQQPPMPHTWSVVIRIAWVVGLTFLFSQFRDGTMVILFLALFFAHLPGHRLGINLMRGSRYKVKWYDMGRDWYDGLWVNLMASGETPDDDDEKRGFWASGLVELALSVALFLVLHKLQRP